MKFGSAVMKQYLFSKRENKRIRESLFEKVHNHLTPTAYDGPVILSDYGQFPGGEGLPIFE